MDVITRLKTAKAKECCCGCSLRTGTLILLWIILIIDSIKATSYLGDLVYRRGGVDITFFKFRAAYMLIYSTVGVIVSLFGIFGIQKNIPKYLSYSYYYFLYNVASVFMYAIIAVVKPDWHRNYILADRYAFNAPGRGDLTLIIVVVYLFSGGLLTYFTIIVRSCRDNMEKNQASGRFNSMPDPAAAGYNVA